MRERCWSREEGTHPPPEPLLSVPPWSCGPWGLPQTQVTQLSPNPGQGKRQRCVFGVPCRGVGHPPCPTPCTHSFIPCRSPHLPSWTLGDFEQECLLSSHIQQILRGIHNSWGLLLSWNHGMVWKGLEGSPFALSRRIPLLLLNPPLHHA